MKKHYIKPEINIVIMQYETALLQASGDDDEWNGEVGSIKNATDITSV